MQGLFIDGRRPASKKEVKERVATDPGSVSLEATSLIGNEYDGPVTGMPESRTAYCVGPDPHTSRKFYLNITRTGDKIKVS